LHYPKLYARGSGRLNEQEMPYRPLVVA
jgi:hypothetical protein